MTDDSVYRGTCADCRWWDRMPLDTPEWGTCRLSIEADFPYEEREKHKFRVESDEFASLKTCADFGCNQWVTRKG